MALLGVVSAMLRKVGTLNAPHSSVWPAMSVRSGPQLLQAVVAGSALAAMAAALRGTPRLS
ncbi:MAG: hypothetical protein U1F35_14750 [Steroidobacteraceae bacterium]